MQTPMSAVSPSVKKARVALAIAGIRLAAFFDRRSRSIATVVHTSPMNTTDTTSLLHRLARWDAQRRGLPGEHWLAMALGAYLLLRPRRSLAAGLLSRAAGAWFVGRALSGRDGALARLRRRQHGRDDALIEVAAPWPYDHRVRVSRPRRTGHRAPASGTAASSR